MYQSKLVHWNAFSKNIPENRIAWGISRSILTFLAERNQRKTNLVIYVIFLQINVDFPVSCARKVQFLFEKCPYIFKNRQGGFLSLKKYNLTPYF